MSSKPKVKRSTQEDVDSPHDRVVTNLAKLIARAHWHTIPKEKTIVTKSQPAPSTNSQVSGQHTSAVKCDGNVNIP